ncbi:MAG: glycogen/starch synthase [Sphingobacteriaceae bacterium]|nr:glycogen/starch synthase [Sphingobacteriaceae bacterium]
MKKARVLFVSQDITPYLDETYIGKISRKLPQGIQERGKEIRTFMPKYGSINERRHQLHEVIRLSGMNLVINDVDHPLIIKVASIPSARMQVYFIDNEEFFSRKATLADKTSGKQFDDNDERSMFFVRGVAETVKKLGWQPDIIHCHGWFTSLMPLYIKKYYQEDPLFADTKIVVSLYDDEFPKTLNKKFIEKLSFDGFNKKDVKHLSEESSHFNLIKQSIELADGIIQGVEKLNPDIEKLVKKSGKPFLPFKNEIEYMDAFNEFYDVILEEENVLT